MSCNIVEKDKKTPGWQFANHFCFVVLGRLAVPSTLARCDLCSHSKRFQFPSDISFLFASRFRGQRRKHGLQICFAGRIYFSGYIFLIFSTFALIFVSSRSSTVRAAMASTTTMARGTMIGSGRPLMEMSISSPDWLTVCCV